MLEEDEYEDEDDDGVDVFPAPYADRYVIEVKDFRVKLQINLSEEGGPNKQCNVCIKAVDLHNQHTTYV